MISIIVPNYNHQKFLSQRLDTIFNQTFQDFEVILLDDCSTDDSWEYLKEYKHHPKVSHCIRNEINSGSPFKQWKKGLELAKYDWIWIAESDDFSELDFLESLIAQIDNEVSLIFAKSEFVDEKGLPLFFNRINNEIQSYDLGKKSIIMNGTQFISEFLVYRNYIVNASGVIFRKPKTFPQAILSMKFAGDWFFWLKIIQGGKVIYLPRPLNSFRFHSGTSRIPLDEKTEQRRFAEYFDCIRLGVTLSKRKLSLFRPDFNFLELVRSYFKLRYKYGRFRFYSIFPRAPIYFYSLYYWLFLKSLMKK